MSNQSTSTRVYFLGNPDKASAASVLDELSQFADTRCVVVGSELSLAAGDAVRVRADYLVVIGGDGTLISVARSLGDHQIPLIGVNIGKLGFLAEFSVKEFKRVFDRSISDESIISRRPVLHYTITHNQSQRDSGVAINDCVIQAGPPFRLIELGVSIDEQHLTDVGGDGMIVCSPNGSTAHNLSAGGPIVQPGVDAIGLTPLNPHSLTHKPLVIEREAVIGIFAKEVNPGTTVIIDGQVTHAFHQGDGLTVRRFEKEMMVVRNPLRTPWHKLVKALHWGQAPVNG